MKNKLKFSYLKKNCIFITLSFKTKLIKVYIIFSLLKQTKINNN
jgi:hypothetical protein